MAIRTIIFDLSEVLIAGLAGIEKPLAEQFRVPEDAVLAAFGGELLEALCRGKISEEFYLAQIIDQQAWGVTIDGLKEVIRQNMLRHVSGMKEIVEQLAQRYEMVLLSDHGSEFVEYVRANHPWLGVFKKQIYSFETGQLKGELSTFQTLLERIDRKPESCLFIDDNPNNVENAKAAGIQSIRFIDSGMLRDELMEYGIIVFSNAGFTSTDTGVDSVAGVR